MGEFVAHRGGRVNAHIREEQVYVFGWRVVHQRLENVLARTRFQHLLHVFLVQWELLRKLVRFAKDVDRLLEVLGDQRHAIRAHLVHDAAIGQDSLAPHKHTVDHRH